MPRTVWSCLATIALVTAAGPVDGQVAEADRPTRHVPVHKTSRADQDHVRALGLFAQGLLHERNHRLLEALRAYEAARTLDPRATPVHKALVHLYLALDRLDDALAACRRILEIDPGDYETGYLYARQLRAIGRPGEARAALERTAAMPGLKDRLDLRAQVFFDLGVMYETDSVWDRAEASFREVTTILDNPAALQEHGHFNRDEINAQAAETCERLGRACLKAGHPDRAVAAFRKAQAKDPVRAARLSYNLAEVHVQQGQPGQALERLNEYLATQPQGTEGYEMRMRLQRQLGREADVLPQLEQAAGRDPHNTALALLLAREYRRAGRGEAAERIYQQVAERSPGPEVYRGLFDLYKEQGEAGTNRALLRLDRAVSRAAGDGKQTGDAGQAAHARAMLQVLRADAELVRRLLVAARARARRPKGLDSSTRTLLATLAARTQQLDVAETLYRSCLEQTGGPGALEQEVYGGLLQVLSQGHKHEAIVAVCERGLREAQATNRVLFHVDLARSQAALGHLRAALAAANAAVEESGEKERLFCRRVRAEVLTQAGRHTDAVAECQALLKEYNQPGDVRNVRASLSAAYAAAGDHERSEEQLQLILKADPTDATANNDLGYQWADRNKNLEEAERLVRKALDLDRRQRESGTTVGVDGDHDNAAYVDSLGWVLFRRGRLTEARQELEKAAALAGGHDDPVVWDHLGDVTFRQGERARAVEAWRKALALYEAGARRRDERYREIQDKLRRLEH